LPDEQGPPPRDGVAAVDGARLAYRVRGEGPDLVLVHAGVADQRMWAPVATLLEHRFRILTYDMRGFGRSTSTPGAYSDSGDLLALIDELAIEHCTLVGASLGGRVALELAAIAPERVQRLVLLDTGLADHDWSTRIEEFDAAQEAAVEAGRIADAVELSVELWAGGADPDVQALVREMYEQAIRLQVAVELDERPLDPPLSARLSDLRMPVSVAYGDRDVEDFVQIATRLAAELPLATLHRIPDAGHLPALEQPEAVAELIAGR
jgi:3-oxoadipate enol-lactonase